MNNINKLNTKNSDDIFVDDDGIEWKKVCSRDYVLMTDDEPWLAQRRCFLRANTVGLNMLMLNMVLRLTDIGANVQPKSTSKRIWKYIWKARFIGRDKNQ